MNEVLAKLLELLRAKVFDALVKAAIDAIVEWMIETVEALLARRRGGGLAAA